MDLYATVANRLSEPVENVRDLSVDVDDKRQLLSVVMTDRTGTAHVASALSDGTLRFLALAVMEADPRSAPLICLEEPENGIHPERVGAVITLLHDLAVAPTLPVDDSNPLRQVIINTHSPSVVACVDDGALIAATEVRAHDANGVGSCVIFYPLPDTWRSRVPDSPPSIAMGTLLGFLDPIRALAEHIPPHRP